MLWQKSHEVYHLSYFCYLLNVSYSIFENFIHTYLDHIHCHPLSLHPPVFKRIVQNIKAVMPGLATCHKMSSSSQVEASSSAENLLVSNIDTYPSHWCPSCPVDTMTLGSLRSGIPQECVSPCDRPVSVSTIALGDIPHFSRYHNPFPLTAGFCCVHGHTVAPCHLLMDTEVTSEQRYEYHCVYSSPPTPHFQFLCV